MSLAVACANPFRPADWRWQRAVQIVAGEGPRTTKRLDTPKGYSWIRQAVSFKRAVDAAAGNDTAMANLAHARPDLYWAYHAWSAPQPQIKSSLEAHILARGTDFEIGFRLGMPPAVVAAYEAVFFNVREKLKHPQYIIHTVLADAQRLRGAGVDNQGLLWKLYGYFYGPHVLASLESGFVNPQFCVTPDGVNSAWLDDTISTLKMKAALAAKTVPINAGTQLSLIEQFTKFVEVERTTDTAGKAQSQVLDHIEAMMKALPFAVDGRDPQSEKGRGKSPPGPLDRFRNAGFELTYEENIRVSIGQPLADEEMLRQLDFPDALPALPAPT